LWLFDMAAQQKQMKTYTEVLALIDNLTLHHMTDREAIEWLDKYIPNWMETHDTKVTRLDGEITND